MRRPEPARVIGWDAGGAHLKACLLENGRVADVAQWACPLWQGLVHLHDALTQAAQRWPHAMSAPQAVTMTGEMTDLFADRADGVQQITDAMQSALPGPVRVYAGPGSTGLSRWIEPHEAGAHWDRIASANWLATAQHVAAVVGDALLVDIGSTTTDLVRTHDGGVDTDSRCDRDRLASGELVYHGVVRTPLCALAHRIKLRGQALNVMNELFATTADVYRLCGELPTEHDLHPSADQGPKTAAATRQRLARMVGCDVRDADDDDWLAMARSWRGAQVDALAASLRLVLGQRPLPQGPLTVVSAGCGDFLVADVLHAACPEVPVRLLSYGRDVAPTVHAGASAAAWAQVCAPSVAVASLYDGEHR